MLTILTPNFILVGFRVTLFMLSYMFHWYCWSIRVLIFVEFPLNGKLSLSCIFVLFLLKDIKGPS